VTGGSEGNTRLTAHTAVVLLVLLAAEGATIVAIGQLLVPHVFIGFLLIPPIALKLASVGWRMTSYYRGRDVYVLHGPPVWLLRFVVGPLTVVSTFALFGTGIAVVALGRRGLVLGAHKLSFIVWFGAMAVHVLAHVWKLPALVRDRLPGRNLRLALLAASLAAGAVLAAVTLPLADHWQDSVTAAFGLDAQ
jgi:hypothetical protein